MNNSTKIKKLLGIGVMLFLNNLTKHCTTMDYLIWTWLTSDLGKCFVIQLSKQLRYFLGYDIRMYRRGVDGHNRVRAATAAFGVTENSTFQ